MENADFTTTVLVNKSPKEVFNAINNVRGWWSEEIDGTTDKLNEEFNYHYEDVHRCKIRVTELVPYERIVWLIVENYFKFTADESEWTRTKVVFEIAEVNERTQVKMTHVGLVPAYECYDICKDSWGNYIQNSLRSLIEIGKGKPNGKGKPQTENEKQLTDKEKH
jgi:uncharacterized protein YndB with AHSA1/START domain